MLLHFSSEKLIFILLINILFSVQVDPIFYNTSINCGFIIDKSLDSYKKFLLEIMHGKLPFKIESTSKINDYDINFIEKINGNIPCPYTLKSLDLDEQNNGIFLGAGINLLNFNSDEMDDILRYNFYINPYEKERIKSYCQKRGEEAKNLTTYGFKIFNIREFNKVIIDYLIEEKIKNDFPSIFNRELKTPFLNGFLSMYIQLAKIDKYFPKDIINNYSISYIIKYLFEGAPFGRFIQSALILMMDGYIKYNNYHLFFVIPMLFEKQEINNIKELIVSFTKYLYNGIIYNRAKISILFFNDDNKNELINYNPRRNKALDQLFNTNFENKTDNFNFTEIYDYVISLYEEYKREDYENRIIALFLDINITKKYLSQINFAIDKYKKEGIQTILYINKPESLKSSDLIKYNLFWDFNQTFYIGQLKMAVCFMHINMDLTNENENFDSGKNVEKKIENIRMSELEAPLYIEVNINREENESVYYEISLQINETDGYNIFISDNNPFPNVKDYTSKFIKYDNNLNPILRIKTNLISQFYIAIEGILYFNLTVKKRYNIENNELILSEGEYNEMAYNISVYFKDETIKNLESFTYDYRPESNSLKNNITLDSILKYFTRGIDLANTDDGLFFNYKLFTYLFANAYLINTVYRNSESKIYYMGRYFELNDNTPYKLKDEGLDQLLINKLYPFINGNNLTLIDKDPPSISFNEQELKLIYNITNRRYVLNLINLLNRTSNAINFIEQSAEVKFVLLCLYFQSSKDNLQNIKILAQREPKYFDVLNNLKNKYKNPDNSNKFMISFISNLEQEIKFEKIIISVIVGKSFILSDIGIKFIEDFFNTMTKAKAKISLLVYDTLRSENNIKIIIPFFNKKTSKLEIINEYRKEFFNIRNSYNNTNEQIMDFDKIINYGLSYLSKYDIGIKKEIFIVCDENIHTSENIYINNKLTNLNYNKHKQLRSNQIKLILISTKNAEKGEIHELFQIKTEKDELQPYTIIENYFHVNNFEDTNMYMNDLSRMAKEAIIKLNLGTRLINDFYQGKLNFYELNCEDYLTDIIVIKANLSNFNFYYSFENPFPNSYIDIKADKFADDDKIVISDLKKDKIYLGIESKNDIQKQVIEIFSCESYYNEKQYKNCKFVESHRFLWYGFFLLLACFLIGLIVYNFGGQSNYKNKINIFQ